jgi:two-component system sensor kinase FixL
MRVDGTFHDITDLKNAEEKHRRLAVELARVSRRSSAEEMASGLALELKQLVAGITVCAHGTRQHLTSQTASVRDVDEALDLILQHAARATDAIGRVRWAGGEGEIAAQDIDLNEIIRDAVDLVRGEAEARNVQVDLDLAGNLPRVTADPIQIAQVIVNLARNSVEAVAGIDCPRRTLRVSTGRKNGSRIWFRVEDAGLGIPDDVRGQLFYPYVSTKSGSLGTGLLICQRIIEAHAGEFAVGDKVSGGIVASFTLPIVEKKGPADAGPEARS